MSGYYDGLNLKLLQAIPSDARQVLELGCAHGRLGQRFKETHPDTRWTGVELNTEAARQAATVLDRVIVRDLDLEGWAGLGNPFDVIVIGDLLEHLKDPEAALSALYELGAPDARIVCCLPNMTHLSVIHRMIAGDISYDENGLLDRTHTRFFSPSSAFKTFLDAGWLPHLHDRYDIATPPGPFTQAVVQAAAALGVPEATARRNLDLYQMILVCRKWSLGDLARPAPTQPFSVIVPVTRPWQYELNLAKSPGLAEVGAEVIPIQGAASAADAYRQGASLATHPWRMMVHQDVYFPVGTGLALSRCFGGLQAAGVTILPIGFAGLEPAGTQGSRYAGLVVDRTSLFTHAPSRGAISMDEFAVALHRDAAVEPDPALGWHLWATDLCLQACELAGQPVAQIAQVPLFHNSSNDYTLPASFFESARCLLEKYPHLDRIATLCGLLSRGTRTDAGSESGGVEAAPARAFS
jgi:SAM-dependent methyltransferase